MAIMTAINSVVDNRSDFVGAFRENVIWVLGSYSEHIRTELDEQLEQLQDEMMELIESSGKAGTSYDDFNGRYQAIAEQLDELKQEAGRGGGAAYGGLLRAACGADG